MQEHFKEHHVTADLNQCFYCDGPKMRQEVQHNRCPNCGVYWCLIKNCNQEYELKAVLHLHQQKNHSSDLDVNLIESRSPSPQEHSYFIKTQSITEDAVYKCLCGNVKMPKDDIIQSVCTQCGRHWCMVKYCNQEFLDATNLADHLRKHRSQSKITECFACKAEKPRENLQDVRGICQNCSIHWCLSEGCNEEFEKIGQLLNHQWVDHGIP